MTGSALLDLAILARRLREDGSTPTPEALEWALASLLADVICAGLTRCRESRLPVEPDDEAMHVQLDRLRDDFSHRQPEREAWSSLYYRYVFRQGMRVSDVAAAARPGGAYADRHIRRRIERGTRLLADALREMERPATGSVRPRHSIPEPLTRFIGRERELAEVGDLLASYRLVTITGFSGMGKSRLAAELARNAVRYFRDGACFVELGALEDPRHVLPTVAVALGLTVLPRLSPGAALESYLREKHLLLVLDNCERVTDACSDLAEALLGPCPDLQLLATSHERMRVTGEAVWAIPTMTLPGDDVVPHPSAMVHYDAVRLLLDRAREALPALELTDANAGHILRICRALDGIPLATELAAGRLGALSLEELAARLEGRFEALRGARPPQRPHHQTLRNTLEWSYGLLDEPEKLLFRRLSVFDGGWTLAAAQRVCSGRGLAASAIAGVHNELVGRSLVEARRNDDTHRFRMIETVRHYAAAMLAATEERDLTRDRHLDYCLALAENADPNTAALLGVPLQAARNALDAETENVRTATRWALGNGDAHRSLRLVAALATHWERRGALAEGREFVERALGLADEQAVAEASVGALIGAAGLAFRQGDFAAAREFSEKALALSSSMGDEGSRANALLGLAKVSTVCGEIDRARAMLEESLVALRRAGDRHAASVALAHLAILARRTSEFELSGSCWRQSLAIKCELGDRRGMALAYHGLGVLAIARGDGGTAREMLEEALTLARDLGEDTLAASALGNLGIVSFQARDIEASLHYHEESLEIRRHLGDRSGVANELNSLGTVAHEHGDLALAESYYSRGADLYREITERDGLAVCLRNLASVHEDRKSYAAARQLYVDSLKMWRDIGDRLWIARVMECLARLAIEMADHERALRMAGAAAALRDEIGAAMTAIEHERLDEQLRMASRHVKSAGALLTQGGALTTSEAVAYALGEVTWGEVADTVAQRLAVLRDT